MVAYLKIQKGKGGYVGVGRVVEKAVKINNFFIEGKTLNDYDLEVPRIYENANNDNTEYPVKIDWIKTFDRLNGKWKSKIGLFSSQLIKASLQNQLETTKFIEEEFDINLHELLLN